MLVTDYIQSAWNRPVDQGLEKMEREDPKHALKFADEIIRTHIAR